MNVELLTEVRDFIVRHPRNICMRYYSADTESCGTVGCIAGWAEILSGKEPSRSHLQPQSLLRINTPQAYNLFYTGYWPRDLRSKLLSSNGQAYANIVAERINHFIKTNGDE